MYSPQLHRLLHTLQHFLLKPKASTFLAWVYDWESHYTRKMEWNIMEPGDSGASGIGCVIDDMYIPSDDCEGNVYKFLL